MAARELEEIRRSLRPIFFSTWILGVPHVSYRYSYRLIYSAVIAAIYIITFSATFQARLSLIVSPHNAGIMMPYLFSQFVTFITGIGTVVFHVAKGARALEDGIVKLAELDVEFKDLGMEVKQRNIIVRRQIGLIVLFFSLWMIAVIINDSILNLIGVNKRISIFQALCLACSSHGPHLLVLFGELVLSTIMYVFYLRFRWINQILRKISKDRDPPRLGKTFHVLSARNGPILSNGKNRSTGALLLKIQRLYKVHQRLCGITEKIMSSFSWQLYFAVSIAFTLLVYRMLVIYSLSLVTLPHIQLRIGLHVIWIIYYVLKFWIITLTCCTTSIEANKLGIMLHGIAINDEKYHKMLQEYSIQLYQNKLHITAGGFFSIDLSLVNTLISHVTTYIFFAVDAWTANQKKQNETASATN